MSKFKFFNLPAIFFVTSLVLPTIARSDEQKLPQPPISAATGSMNNGIVSIPLLDSDDDSAKKPLIVDSGKSLIFNGNKMPIKGSADLSAVNNLPAELKGHSETEIERFCHNMQSPAQKAYFAMQTKKLVDLRKDVEARIALLEQKNKEYKDWLEKRNAFIAKAKVVLVNIISKMDPEAAASQIAKIDDLSAASLMMVLKPSKASAIMAALPPEKAAYLSEIIINVRKEPKTKNNSAPEVVTDEPQAVQ